MRTIRSMRKRLKGRIYIRCGTLEIHKQFIQDAEAALNVKQNFPGKVNSFFFPR